MIRCLALVGILLYCPSALGQALHLPGTRSGAGLGVAFMAAEESLTYALSLGFAFADQWDAGVVYGSTMLDWPSWGGGGTYRRKANTGGVYLGFVPATADRNDLRVRIGVSGQAVSETGGGSGNNTLLGLDFAAAKPFGGAAYILPGFGGGILFPLSHMQPTTVASASLGLGVRGPGGSFLVEPSILYVPAGGMLSKGVVVTVAFALTKPAEQVEAPTQARTSAR